ncbi:MAG: transcriptional regulator [Bacteroidaceae bacterium]|nr:transcriptional regulator [Bacteroidaceae bacterium]
MNSEPAIGTRMMISPNLTHKEEWLQGNLIEVEHNRYRGLVYVVKTDAGEIFFSVADDFKNC